MRLVEEETGEGEVDLNMLEIWEIDLHLPRTVDNLERIAVELIFVALFPEFLCFTVGEAGKPRSWKKRSLFFLVF